VCCARSVLAVLVTVVRRRERSCVDYLGANTLQKIFVEKLFNYLFFLFGVISFVNVFSYIIIRVKIILY